MYNDAPLAELKMAHCPVSAASAGYPKDVVHGSLAPTEVRRDESVSATVGTNGVETDWNGEPEHERRRGDRQRSCNYRSYTGAAWETTSTGCGTRPVYRSRGVDEP
jgi:hypothetical protein